MDLSTLISSLITGAFAVMVCIINNNATMKKRDIEQEKTLAVIETKLENLTNEVRQHNNYFAKIPTLETKVQGLERRVSVLENKQ